MSVATSVEANVGRTAERTANTPRTFPTVDLVDAAAGLFSRERQPDRNVSVQVGPAAIAAHESRRAEHFAGTEALTGTGEVLPWLGELEGFADLVTEEVEGPRWYVEVAPGLVAVRSTDPARAQRAAERALQDHRARVRLEVAAAEHGWEASDAPQRQITGWSAKSRSKMVRRLAELDYAPLLVDGERLGMVTLTYPGDWLTVAGDSPTCHRHLLALRKRFERRYGRKLVAVWKREFQARGAPHYHILMSIPADVEGFREWLAQAWVQIVAHPDEFERLNHYAVTRHDRSVDFVDASRMSDPKRAGVYFSKHGAFAAKDYQNDVPAEWEGSPAGRFWGYWHLDRAVAGVEVAPDVARAVVRTARRYAAAQRPTVKVDRWRRVTTIDKETGELGWRWRKRRTTVRVRRLTRAAGYLVVNNGPAFAGQLAAYADQVTRPRRGSGPVGFLP